MNLRNEIKSKVEYIPLFLVLEAEICFIFSYFKLYKEIFDAWEELTCCSLLMCVILYGFSENWGLLSKKCLLTCVLLNILNLVDKWFKLDDTYYIWFQSLFYGLGLFLMFYELYKKTWFKSVFYTLFLFLILYKLCKYIWGF